MLLLFQQICLNIALSQKFASYWSLPLILNTDLVLNILAILPNRMYRLYLLTRRGVGVADRAGFENRCALLGYRGFESRPLRYIFTGLYEYLKRGGLRKWLFEMYV
jgi:hypothetical protein